MEGLLVLIFAVAILLLLGRIAHNTSYKRHSQAGFTSQKMPSHKGPSPQDLETFRQAHNRRLAQEMKKPVSFSRSEIPHEKNS
jgi:hypothetical protein